MSSDMSQSPGTPFFGEVAKRGKQKPGLRSLCVVDDVFARRSLIGISFEPSFDRKTLRLTIFVGPSR
jgi:hypothetical protein